MYLMKTINKRTVSQLVEYKNVIFPYGFSTFLESLERSDLLPHDTKSVFENGTYSWNSEKIRISTTSHPFFSQQTTLIVEASPLFQKVIENCLLTNNVLIEDKTSTEVDSTIRYHDTLNPIIWSSSSIIKLDVKKALLKVANAYQQHLDLPDMDVIDIVITGSSANYNWTKYSDIDLHFIVDLPKAEETYGGLTSRFLETVQKLWNENHTIQIEGIRVELYVQDKDEEHHSAGIYSLMNNKWNVEPKHEAPTIDSTIVIKKVDRIKNKIDELTSTCTKASDVEKAWEQIKQMRKSGLEKCGEYAVENLVFKTLRNIGYLEKLNSCRDKQFDRKLSITDDKW